MRVIASQKLPQDSGESIFAARHQDVSQGPLGLKCRFVRDIEWRDTVRSLIVTYLPIIFSRN